jgi:tRNA (cytidine(34)-2'-O)-methyltransferase
MLYFAKINIMTLHIALYEPEIPPNTGNIIRLCANSHTQLHLIHPLGFDLNEKACRRAGLDYKEYVDIKQYDNAQDFFEKNLDKPIYACTTKGSMPFNQPDYTDESIFLFGPETRGLPNDVLAMFDPEQRIRIPMHANSRSLNLSNSVAIILYEGLRQLHYPGLI